MIAAIATVAITFTRPKDKRVSALMGGCIAVLMSGMLGMATGLVAVSHNADKFPDKLEAIRIGLGELANNGTFAATLTGFLGLAALVLSFTSKPSKSETPA
ncbi:MAG: hypothetical protein R3B70_26720 [Polyangiaceae bacterium]